jgi:hypothetical protein
VVPSYHGDAGAPTGRHTLSGLASPQISPAASLAAELRDTRDSDLVSLEILRKLDRVTQGEDLQ